MNLNGHGAPAQSLLYWITLKSAEKSLQSGHIVPSFGRRKANKFSASGTHRAYHLMTPNRDQQTRVLPLDSAGALRHALVMGSHFTLAIDPLT